MENLTEMFTTAICIAVLIFLIALRWPADTKKGKIIKLICMIGSILLISLFIVLLKLFI